MGTEIASAFIGSFLGGVLSIGLTLLALWWAQDHW